jgi:hypothetical protein
VPGEKNNIEQENDVWRKQNDCRNQQMPFSLRVRTECFLVFIKDLQIAILRDKNIVEENCRQQINGSGKNRGFCR